MNGGPKAGRTLHLRQRFGVDDWLDRAADAVLARADTCALDLVQGGALDLNEIAEQMGVSRFQSMHLVEAALEAVRSRKVTLWAECDEDEGAES